MPRRRTTNTANSLLRGLVEGIQLGTAMRRQRSTDARSERALSLQEQQFQQQFEEDQRKLAAQRQQAGETEKALEQIFPPEQGTLQLGQQFQGQGEASKKLANQPVRFREDVLTEGNVGPGAGMFLRSLNPSLNPQPFASGNAVVKPPTIESEPAFPMLPPEQFIAPGPGIPDVNETVNITRPNQNPLGQLLKGLNTPETPLNPSVLLQAIQNEQAAQAKVDSATTKFKRDIILKGMDINSRELISSNSIASKEQIADLDRQAKAGERIKALVKLGNDPKTGRPITQVGFAKRNNPSDIVFVGKPTTSSPGTNVNVNNLPQIPTGLLTAITQSDTSLKSVERLEEILKRVDASGLIGPIDSAVGSFFEKIGMPDQDQQTIMNISIDLTDSLGRMRSGGVISEEEWQNFQRLVPQRSDNYPTFVNKLRNFKLKLQDIRDANITSAQTFGFNIGTAQQTQPETQAPTLEELKAEQARRKKANGGSK